MVTSPWAEGEQHAQNMKQQRPVPGRGKPLLLTAKIKMGPGRRHFASLLSKGDKRRREGGNMDPSTGILPRHTEG